jgi:DNA mismatch repair protein MutS
VKQTEKVAKGVGTPMMKQYLAIKRQYPDTILFFRMGDFYEMFMDDAVTAADVLKIALTTRDKGKENAVPMCGIPYHAADSYLTRLVQAGHKVAICEQVEDPAKARGLVRREVTRVVTPGTAVEENLLEAAEPSFLAAISVSGSSYGIAVVDVSTGQFLVSLIEGKDALSILESTLVQYDPREVLLPEGVTEPVFNGHMTFIEPHRFNTDLARETLLSTFDVRTLSGFGPDLDGPVLGAAGAALWYLGEVLNGIPGHLSPPRAIVNEDILILDSNTLRNLEILRSSPAGDRQWSLLGIMDFTITAQGARLLREMLIRPLRRVDEIEARLDLIEELVSDPMLRTRIRTKLRGVSDVERIVSRFSARTAGPREAKALAQTLEEIPGTRRILSELNTDLGDTICRAVSLVPDLGELLERALVDSPPVSLRDGGLFREGYNRELDELRAITKDSRRFLSDLEATERQKTKIPNLKIGFNKVFGYYFEVTHPHRDLVPPGWIRKQTLVNAERYITEELKKLEDRILSARERMIVLERELFEDLRTVILEHTESLQLTARALAQADVYTALAELAHSSSYVRPKLVEDDPEGRIIITQGRHPVLERSEFTETFVPNDAYLDAKENRMIIITGPNMAGKSTYMRQIALILIMAQMGSYVPAKEAIINPVDRVFTRVGASDILTKGLSTFMVEMVQTASILNNATPKSLVILDEIGRGTSTFDGISIAWAVAEQLLNGTPKGCRTLFATHYHELTELALTNEGVKNQNVAIREWGERLVFLHRVHDGASDKSYGISVARLAGLPDGVIARAKKILANLESHALDREGVPVLVAEGEETPCGQEETSPQLGLFDDEGREILRVLKEVDLDEMTPIEAMNLLSRLKKRFD